MPLIERKKKEKKSTACHEVFPQMIPLFCNVVPLLLSNLFLRHGTPVLLPGNLGNPHPGSRGCSCLACWGRLAPERLLYSTWSRRSAGPGRSSGRSGWLPGSSPSVETWWSCRTCPSPAFGHKWRASSPERSCQPGSSKTNVSKVPISGSSHKDRKMLSTSLNPTPI